MTQGVVSTIVKGIYALHEAGITVEVVWLGSGLYRILVGEVNQKGVVLRSDSVEIELPFGVVQVYAWEDLTDDTLAFASGPPKP